MTFQAQAKKVIEIEKKALEGLLQNIDTTFDSACALIKRCKGRVVVIGMGKSGLVGNKIAATLASTGTPAFSVNAAEAGHGDLGMIKAGDIIIAISHSGHTEEIITLLPALQRLNVPVISLCGSPRSPLATFATINLDVGVAEEACPLGLAPTASTTATMVLGDALAISLLKDRGFSHEDFALSHPGGSIGKRLLVKVSDLMCKGDRLPTVTETDNLETTIMEITQKGLGMTCVKDDKGNFVGVFTDGDLRRAFENKTLLSETDIRHIMTKGPKTIGPNELAIDALTLMEASKITSLPVIDTKNTLIGIIHMHALLSAGIQGAQHGQTLSDGKSKKDQAAYS